MTQVMPVASDSHPASDAADTDQDVQVCGMVDAPQQNEQQLQQPSHGQATAPALPSSAAKRRKTGNPRHRAVSADQPQGSVGAQAPTGGKEAARDKNHNSRSRASPSWDRAGGTEEGLTGGGNPPMSPVAGLAGQQRHTQQRTPRSHGKHQTAHNRRGQTNINRFFSVMDGSSRESDTPVHTMQQLQQHHSNTINLHQPQPSQQQGTPLPIELTPIEDVFIDTAHPAQQQDQQQPQQPNVDAFQSGWQRPHAGGAGQQQMFAGLQQQGPPPASVAGPAQRSSWVSRGSSCDVDLLHQQQLQDLQAQHQQEVEQLKHLASQVAAQLQTDLSTSQQQVQQLTATIQQLQQELAVSRSTGKDQQAAARSAVASLVTQLAVSSDQLCRLQLSVDGSRLGSLGFSRTGPLGFTEVWEDGPLLRSLSMRLAQLLHARDEVEAARKALRKRLPPPPKATAAVPNESSSATSAPGDGTNISSSSSHYLTQAEFVMQDELLKVRLSVLKREEEGLMREQERLQHEKLRHIRGLKRLHDEEASRFSGQPVLNSRYVLLQLLGRGGCGEVHRAYDLDALRFVAVKIHQLVSSWSEARKSSYVRHAVREYQIHRALHHRNIVSLKDIFEVDTNTFATVLELCEGGDLESHLQLYHVLPEREARAIIAQVFSGLAHLNRADGSAEPCGPRIIHYDLKPANILFDSLGTVKITDFGLSKVVEEGQTMGMELTSQGAGTYWYLPPECFAKTDAGSSLPTTGAGRQRPAAASTNGLGQLLGGLLGSGGAQAAPAGPRAVPLISNKVDVWSAGVILFQMLYGRRPFGDGLTQEQILRDGVMLNARQVCFPAKPAVSADGKAFISHCLAYNAEDRWDVLTAAADPYLQLKR